jgi:putative aldouronate transport system permease protein
MTQDVRTAEPVPAHTSAVESGEPRKKSRRRRSSLSFTQRVRRDWPLLAMMIPGLLYFVVFQYLPLLGNIIAFQDYQPYLGFSGSPFVGLENFSELFSDPAFWQATVNTLKITMLQLIFFFPAPICLALLLNSIAGTRIKRFVQSVVYIPHFIGWVVIVSLFQQVLGPTGGLHQLLDLVGVHQPSLTTSPGFFPWLMVLEIIWKDTGWGTIIFLAALMNIDQNLYESSAIDGAGKWRRLWHITLPSIRPVIILLLILQLGNALTVGFEQILLQRNNVGATAGEVLDTYVYYHGVVDGQWGVSAAAGLIKGLVGLVLVLGANKLAHTFGQDGIYRRDDR